MLDDIADCVHILINEPGQRRLRRSDARLLPSAWIPRQNECYDVNVLLAITLDVVALRTWWISKIQEHQ